MNGPAPMEVLRQHLIDPEICIRCNTCEETCPVDAIVGAAKLMHTIVPDLCTGCDLCVAPCPVDCIVMYPVTETTGWAAWSQPQADAARERHDHRALHLRRDREENDARLAAKAVEKMRAVDALDPASAAEQAEKERKRAIIAAAMERARLKKQAAMEDVKPDAQNDADNPAAPPDSNGSPTA